MYMLARKIYRDFVGDNDDKGRNVKGGCYSVAIELDDQPGWKRVQGDVFRAPPYSILLASLLGSGAHVFSALVATILLTSLFPNWFSSFFSVIKFAFFATSPANGFCGATSFSRFGGREWIRQALMGVCLLPGFVCAPHFVVCVYATIFSMETPLTTWISVSPVLLLALLGLNVGGAFVGRRLAGKANNPCPVNAAVRRIPRGQWFNAPISVVMTGGVLPFVAMCLKAYLTHMYVLTYKSYYLTTFLVTMCLITAFVSAVSTYFLLSCENHRWHWISFFVGTSTIAYIYFSCVFFVVFTYPLSGFSLAFSLYLLTSICGVTGVMCGAVGYFSASMFVHRLYSSVRSNQQLLKTP